VGWCLGGHLALRAALWPDVRAAACFYPTDVHADTLGAGMSSDSKQRMTEIRGELLLVFGKDDPHVPRDGRRAIHDALNAANVRFDWHEVDAVHAFMRDEGARYDPALAALGYALALSVFERTLKVA
jgi:carboxymethylenebutenolidase